MKHLFAILLIMALSFSVCAYAAPEIEPMVEEPVTITVFMPLEATVALTSTNLADLPVLQYIMDKTGVKLEFMHPVSGSEKETMNSIIASGDYPDVFRYSMDNYSGGFEGAIEDEVIIDLTDLVEQNAPNFMAMLESNPFFDKAVRNDKGQIVGFGMVFGNEAQRQNIAYVGPVLRQDWLDECGLDTPVTIDDWYEMLTAFKEHGHPNALGIGKFLTGDWYSSTGIFASAYGTAVQGFYLKDGKVAFAPYDQEYKSFVELLAKWYAEDLINPDFITEAQIADVVPSFHTGEFGATFMHVSNISDAYSANADDPNFAVGVAPYPVLNEGDVLTYRNLHWGISAGPGIISISTTNPNPELTVKFFDRFYSPEWQEMLTWGLTEGDDYVIDENGGHAFTEKITNNPDGLTYNAARYKYTLAALPGAWDWELEAASYIHDVQLYASMDLWRSLSFESVLPTAYITMDAEEKTRYNEIMTDVNTFVEEKIYGFILGRESLDQWDQYIETLQSMGIEEATQIYQTAYERYLNR